MKRIAVQIVTYNSESEIVPCLKSIKEQSYPISDILVVDNQSMDGTVDCLKTSPYYQDMTLVENKVNNGFAGGHNQAFQLSDSDYVLVLNPDVQLHPDYVYHLVQELEQNLQVGAATGKLYREQEHQVLDSSGLIIKKNHRAFDRGAGETDNGQYDRVEDIFGVSGAAAMYRREMIADVSIDGEFFDETFFAYKEDVDVAWRAQLFGWKAMFVPEAVAHHKRGWQGEKKRTQISLKVRKYSYINRYYTMLKNDSFFYLLLHLPIILFYEVLSLGYATLKEREILSSWKDFRKNFYGMMNKRKIVKNKRKVPYREVYRYFRGIW
ncbi:glycosyltransferase family 2 protein [Schinkia azotoformans]|uniref:glycosyltransferase family 2 protein n=1 Tax=Schinkia azotoformans TaxID=1454 RepID=UPI002DBBBD9B|nr:glycosyltransferase family 2 protein [Schinkia azotoformans]MEC1744268.1 glycosyltransferase family 2 protein [Schinkia azotoformans]MEC1759503.1 glycosyltransferase family 2 protein [Schinkia azotoformans]